MVRVAARRELVYEVVAAAGRTVGDTGREKLVEFETRWRGRVIKTIEAVELDSLERIRYRWVEGPLEGVEEEIRFKDSGLEATELIYSGRLQLPRGNVVEAFRVLLGDRAPRGGAAGGRETSPTFPRSPEICRHQGCDRDPFSIGATLRAALTINFLRRLRPSRGPRKLAVRVRPDHRNNIARGAMDGPYICTWRGRGRCRHHPSNRSSAHQHRLRLPIVPLRGGVASRSPLTSAS
jgi:hypothetical protein